MKARYKGKGEESECPTKSQYIKNETNRKLKLGIQPIMVAGRNVHKNKRECGVKQG